jgi:hypothetical protein
MAVDGDDALPRLRRRGELRCASLRARLAAAAKRSLRSLNSEAVYRLSSHRIHGPADVLACEVFGGPQAGTHTRNMGV